MGGWGMPSQWWCMVYCLMHDAHMHDRWNDI
jgi:hypothetical protein